MKIQTLTDMKFISTPDLTIFCIAYTLPLFQYVTTLKGFLFMDDKEKNSEKEVTEIVEETHFSTTASSETITSVRRFLANFQDNCQGHSTLLLSTCFLSLF
jgi:hypothetical protein